MGDSENTNVPLTDQSSPARQLLSALSKTSAELENRFNETHEHVSRLNAQLERAIAVHLEENSERVEVLVRNQLDGLTAERDAVLARLTELRQEELKVLQDMAKDLRKALSDKLEMLVEDLKGEFKGAVSSFELELKENVDSSATKIEEARKTLKEKLPEHLQTINDELEQEKSNVEKIQLDYLEKFAQETESSLREIDEVNTELVERLETVGGTFLGSVDKSARALIDERMVQIEHRVSAFSQMETMAEEKISGLSADGVDYLSKLPTIFLETCKELAQLRLGLHETSVNNLGLQYRTQILSATQEAEDQLHIVGSSLQSKLRNFQTYYSDHFEAIVQRFEKSARELVVAAGDEGIVHGEDVEIARDLTEHFSRLRDSISRKVDAHFSSTELEMEKTVEEFSTKLADSRREVCLTLEENVRQGKLELESLDEHYHEQIKDLGKKLDEMERSISEAADLISALDQASCLDFEV